MENPPCIARSTRVGARFTRKGTGQATVGVNPPESPISMGTSDGRSESPRITHKHGDRQEGSGWGPDPPCRRKETTVRRRTASGPVDEGNGRRLPAGLVRSHSRSCGVCGGGPSRDYIAAWEERRIPMETGFCLVGKFEQVSNSGAVDVLQTTMVSLSTGWESVLRFC